MAGTPTKNPATIKDLAELFNETKFFYLYGTRALDISEFGLQSDWKPEAMRLWAILNIER